MEPELAYRAVLAVDIERSADRGDVALRQIRDALSTALREAFAQSGIDWDACLRDDLGDGFRVTAPAGVRKTRLIHPLIHELSVRLRAHNRTAGPLTQVRVRAALHAGDVHVGPQGQVTGRTLEVLARMLDAKPSRDALSRAPESVTASLLVSRHFYEETVRHGYPGIDPDTFHRVALAEKEYTASAWLHLPGCAAVPPGAPHESGTAAEPAPGHPAHSKMINKASGNGTVYATQNGTQNITLTGSS